MASIPFSVQGFPYSKPEYFYCTDENRVHISYNQDYEIILDIQDHIDILNCGKKFVLHNDCNYPYYIANNKKMTIIDFIYKFDRYSSNYKFINDYEYDLCRSNVTILHNHNDIIKQKYKIIEYIQGHYNNYGVDAFVLKNPLWLIHENGKEVLLMYCETDTIIKLCKQSYQKILDFEKVNKEKITWFKTVNGYIAGKIQKKQLFIHQIITGCYGNGKGTSNVSVDHIDRDPLNNTMENLRIATREEQEQNTKGIAPNTKRARQTKARPLPEGITQEMLKKYVVYYYNVVDKSKSKAREYFTIERHPKLQKRWETSKSNKIPILEKLHQANKKLEELDNETYDINQIQKVGVDI